MIVRVALVGCGRWGSRLLAALVRHSSFEVAAVVELDGRALARASRIAPGAHLTRSLERACHRVDAAVIATPSVGHAEHARRALELGLHVLVEKPLATRAADARRLAELARMRGRVAMVGHVLRYHPAVERLIALARSGAAGHLAEIHFERHTQSGSAEPLWTLCPHDLATLEAIDASAIVRLSAEHRGANVHLEIALASGLRATLAASTAGAEPRRRMRARGSRGSLVFDELAGTLSVAVCSAAPCIVPLGGGDPLARELEHFARCIRDARAPRTSFAESARIVATLERAHELLAGRAAPAPLAALR